MLRSDLTHSIYIEKIGTIKSSVYESRMMILNDCTFAYFSSLEEMKIPMITSVYSQESGLHSTCLCLLLLRTTLTNCSKSLKHMDS